MNIRNRFVPGFVLILSAVITSSAFAATPAELVENLKKALASHGKPTVDGTYKLSNKDVPILKFGTKVINAEDKTVDSVADGAVSACTIFIRTGDDFIRATTNVKDTTGKPCIGTLLKKTTAVYPDMLAGKSYSGNVDICGSMYDTRYEPIKIGDKVVGIYLCGNKK